MLWSGSAWFLHFCLLPSSLLCWADELSYVVCACMGFCTALVSVWSSFPLDGWELLIGFSLFFVCDDEKALHPLTCGLNCLVLQLLVAFIVTGTVLLG